MDTHKISDSIVDLLFTLELGNVLFVVQISTRDYVIFG